MVVEDKDSTGIPKRVGEHYSKSGAQQAAVAFVGSLVLLLASRLFLLRSLPG